MPITPSHRFVTDQGLESESQQQKETLTTLVASREAPNLEADLAISASSYTSRTRRERGGTVYTAAGNVEKGGHRVATCTMVQHGSWSELPRRRVLCEGCAGGYLRITEW